MSTTKVRNHVPEIPDPPVSWSELKDRWLADKTIATPNGPTAPIPSGEIERALERGNPQWAGNAVPPPMRVATKPAWAVFIGVCLVLGVLAVAALGIVVLAVHR